MQSRTCVEGAFDDAVHHFNLIKNTCTQIPNRLRQESPIVTLGIGLGLTGLAYMLYNIKRRPKGQKLSIYLIHTRLAVCGTIVSSLVAAMGYDWLRYVQ